MSFQRKSCFNLWLPLFDLQFPNTLSITTTNLQHRQYISDFSGSLSLFRASVILHWKFDKVVEKKSSYLLSWISNDPGEIWSWNQFFKKEEVEKQLYLCKWRLAADSTGSENELIEFGIFKKTKKKDFFPSRPTTSQGKTWVCIPWSQMRSV